MAEIIGKLDPATLAQRMEATRLDKPEELMRIRAFGKLRRARARAHRAEELRVRSGKFNSIKAR